MKPITVSAGLSALWLAVFMCASTAAYSASSGSESIESIRYKYRALKNLERSGRYVDPAQLRAYEDEIELRTGLAIATPEEKQQHLLEDGITDDVLDAVKEKAMSYVFETVPENLRDKAEGLASDIRRAETARDVARYLEQHLGSAKVPKDSTMAKFYNEIYNEQSVLAKSLSSKIASKVEEMSACKTLADGIEKVGSMKENVGEKIAELESQIKERAAGVAGMSVEALEEKLEAYNDYKEKVDKYYEMFTQVRDAGGDIRDLSDTARNGVRSLTAVGIILKEAGDKIEVPLIGDALKFYGEATSLGGTAAGVAQNFVVKEGEISVSQRDSKYAAILNEKGADLLTRTEFGDKVGIRVLWDQSNNRNQFYIVNDNYEVVNKEPIDQAGYEKLMDIYANYDQQRRDKDAPLSAEELGKIMDQLKRGEPVELRGKTYDNFTEDTRWDGAQAVQREASKVAAQDIYDTIRAEVPGEAGDYVPDAIYDADASRKDDIAGLISWRQSQFNEDSAEAAEWVKAQLNARLKRDKDWKKACQDTTDRIKAEAELKGEGKEPPEKVLPGQDRDEAKNQNATEPKIGNVGPKSQPENMTTENKDVVETAMLPPGERGKSWYEFWSEKKAERDAEKTSLAGKTGDLESRIKGLSAEESAIMKEIQDLEEQKAGGAMGTEEHIRAKKEELGRIRERKSQLRGDLETALREAEAETDATDVMVDGVSAVFGENGVGFMSWLDYYTGNMDEEEKREFEATQSAATAVSAEKRSAVEQARAAAEAFVDQYKDNVSYEVMVLEETGRQARDEQRRKDEDSWSTWFMNTLNGAAKSLSEGFGEGAGNVIGTKWIHDQLEPDHHRDESGESKTASTAQDSTKTTPQVKQPVSTRQERSTKTTTSSVKKPARKKKPKATTPATTPSTPTATVANPTTVVTPPPAPTCSHSYVAQWVQYTCPDGSGGSRCTGFICSKCGKWSATQ